MYMKMQWIARIVLVLITAFYVGGVVQHAAGTTLASSDEAGSILASKEILSHGLPLVPSQRIYYRSLLPHYLGALSIALVGDNYAWLARSIVACLRSLVDHSCLDAHAPRSSPVGSVLARTRRLAGSDAWRRLLPGFAYLLLNSDALEFGLADPAPDGMFPTALMRGHDG